MMFRKLSLIVLILFLAAAPVGAFAKENKKQKKGVYLHADRKKKYKPPQKNEIKKQKKAKKSSTKINHSDLISQIVAETNHHRHRNKKPSLIESKMLSEIAQDHSKSMASEGKISHDGFSSRFKVIKSRMKSVSGMGENVAMNKNAPSPAIKAVDQWKKSPGHNENMLNKDFRHIGAGVEKGKDGSYYFTQIFTK